MKKRTFKVEIRKTCKNCGKKIAGKRFRTFCSKKCRDKVSSIKWNDYRTNWQRKRRDLAATKPSAKKVKCLVCGKWYVQVCSHVLQVHKMLAREYKTEYGLDVKKGRVPEWYHEMKGEQAIENETYLNLKEGKKYRFKKGSKIAGRYIRSEETMQRLKELGSRTIKTNSKYGTHT